jgi:hypothetical protein
LTDKVNICRSLKFFLMIGIFFVPVAEATTQNSDAEVIQHATGLLTGNQTVRQLHFEFDAEKLNKYSQLIEKGSKEDFESKLTTNLSSEPVQVTAHIRGKGSISCARKHYVLDVSASDLSLMWPDFGVRKYYLNSMCQDESYLRTLTMFQLWNELGLFPFRFSLIEVSINKKSQGLYILLEKATDRLAKNSIKPLSILRRDFHLPETTVFVQSTSTTRLIAELDYIFAFRKLMLVDGDKFVTGLEKTLDVDQYLRHLASVSIVENGDNVDEIWFSQYPRKRIQGYPDYIYRIFKWDPDDIFSKCHWDGKYAYTDPWNLSYCIESELGKKMLSNPVLFNRFVNKIETLLSGSLSRENFTRALNITKRKLLEKLISTEILVAMGFESLPANSVLLANYINHYFDQAVDKLLEARSAREQSLLLNIDKYQTELSE